MGKGDPIGRAAAAASMGARRDVPSKKLSMSGVSEVVPSGGDGAGMQRVQSNPRVFSGL